MPFFHALTIDSLLSYAKNPTFFQKCPFLQIIFSSTLQCKKKGKLVEIIKS